MNIVKICDKLEYIANLKVGLINKIFNYLTIYK